MPAILENLQQKILDAQPNKGSKEAKSKSWAIATSALQKQGKMKRGSQELTQKGKEYQDKAKPQAKATLIKRKKK